VADAMSMPVDKARAILDELVGRGKVIQLTGYSPNRWISNC